MASTTRGHTTFPRYRNSAWDQIVAKAREGSTEHIRELRSVLEPNDCTFELVEGILNHLSPDLIPEEVENQTAAQNHPDVRRAEACYNFLSHLVDDSLQKCDVATRESLTPLLITYLPNVLAWINFFLDFLLPVGPPDMGHDFTYSYHAEFLVGLSDYEKVTEAFLSSKLLLQTFFRIFVGKNKRTGHSHIAWDPRPSNLGDDSILYLCRRLLVDADSGRDVVTEELQSLHMSFDFVSAAIQRAVRVTDAVSDPAFPSSLARYAGRLLGIIKILGGSTTDPNSQALRSCLHRIRPISRLTRMCDRLSYAITTGAGPDELKDVQTAFRGLINVISQLGPLTPHHVRTFLKADGLAMVARVAIHLDSVDTPEINTTMHYLRVVAQYITWPCVFRHLFDENGQSLDQSIEVVTQVPHLKGGWSAFWSKAKKVQVAYQKTLDQEGLTLCDCHNCPNEKRNLYSGPARQCSGCFTAAYCSPVCQFIDWRYGPHKWECSSARQFYIAQKESGAWYSHRSRSLHIKMVEEICEERYTALYERDIKRVGLPVNGFFPTFNFTGPERVTQEMLIFRTTGRMEASVLNLHGRRLGRGEAFRAPRILWLMEEYRDCMVGTNMRLAECGEWLSVAKDATQRSRHTERTC